MEKYDASHSQGFKGWRKQVIKIIYNFLFRQLFEYVSNISCFYIKQDDQAKDGLKKKWTRL